MGNIITWFLIAGIAQVIVGGLVLLLIILLGPILLLKFIFRGRSRENKTTVGGVPSEQTTRRGWGFPTSFYTANKKLGSFGIDPSLYNFRTPRAEPDLSKLREPSKVDIDVAKKLFIGGNSYPAEIPTQLLDMERARDLFLPHFGDGEGDGDEIS